MIPPNLKLEMKNLHPNASVTETGVSDALDLLELSGDIVAALDVSAPVAGSSPTLASKLTECDTEDGEYTDVSGGAFTGITTSASAQKLTLNKDKLKRFVKLSLTIGGTSSPEYYVSGKIYGIKKYG